jgi:(methylthio)acryloyl-CoA hydratase
MVIFGHGPCFSAGLDLAEHRAREAEEVFHHSRAWHAAFTAIRRGHIPVVAALHDATVGGGLELAAACHVRLADTTAFFALREGMHGIYVGGGASVHVARLLGAARMADMMLTGRVLHANMAERAGLVQYLVPTGEALAKAGELAAKMAGMARLTVLGVLHALPRVQDMSEADGLFVDSLMAALSQSGVEAAARPRLVARWEHDCDGRLVCCWQIDDRTEPKPSAAARSMAAPLDHDPRCRRPGDVS